MTLLFFFAENLMGLLTDKVELIQIGTLYLKIMAGSQIPQNMSKVLNGFIRSSGYKTVPMLVSFTGLWLVRVPLSLLAQSVLGWDIVTIWWIINLDQWVRFSISMTVFLKAKLYDAIQAQALA
jgi:Na+-driven multidrug efflux pump